MSFRWVCIYPAYINSKKTRQEGRRIRKDLCVENPTFQEIKDVLSVSNLRIGIENKLYSRERSKVLLSSFTIVYYFRNFMIYRKFQWQITPEIFLELQKNNQIRTKCMSFLFFIGSYTYDSTSEVEFYYFFLLSRNGGKLNFFNLLIEISLNMFEKCFPPIPKQ